MNENGGSVAELEIVRGLERLNVKLDELLRRGDDHEARLRVIEQRDDPSAEQARQLTEQTKQLGDHEARLRVVERWQWKLTGAVVAAGILGGGAGAGVTALFGG